MPANSSNYNYKAPQKKKSDKRNKIITAITLTAAVAAAVLGIILLLQSCQEQPEPTLQEPDAVEATGLELDPNAAEGGWDEADLDAIVESLNEKVDEGMINISMNTSPIFQDGHSAGNLMIVNESINRYPQKVVITRNDTGETIYTSGAIPVGSKIEAAALDVELQAGTYECTAMFHNLDPVTGDSLGYAGAIISITVVS